MPKVSSKNQISFQTEKVDVKMYVDVYYNQDCKFYIEIPDSHADIFDATEESNRPSTRLTGKPHSGNRKRICYADTEEGCLSVFKSFVIKCSEQSISERQVIILNFKNNNSTYRNDKDDIYTNIGVDLSIDFCTEISAAGQTPKYYKFRTYDFNGRQETTRQEVRPDSWGRKNIVIIDTQENRDFLTRLYDNLKILITTLTKFTDSSDSLLDLIESKQKLIS